MNCSVAKRTRKVNTNKNNWDVDAQANIEQVTESINEKVRVNNYSSVAWRNEAMQHSAVFGLTALDEIKRQKNQKITGSIKSYLKNAIRIKLNRVIEARIARDKGIPKATIRKQLGFDNKTKLYSGNLAYVIEQLDNTSESNANLIAWYREAYNDDINEATGISYSDEFFNSVFAQAKLGSVKFDKNDTFGEYELAVALDANEEDDVSQSEQGENPTDTDETNAVAAFDHSGEHKDFMTGVDQEVKTYFDTLKKLKSPESTTDEKGKRHYQFDKENLYEIVNTMDAKACSSVLFHQGDFTDDMAMVESIRRIARQCAGFEAFMQFADDLEENADFRYKVYTNFAKLVMSKMETVVDDKNGKTNLANKRSNATTALSFEFRNTIKSTAVSVDNYEMDNRYNTWNKLITLPAKPTDKELQDYNDFVNNLQNNPTDETVLQVIGELTSMLQAYYPTIDRYAVANYLYNATDAQGNRNVATNLSNLKNILKRTINAAKRSTDNYRSLQYDIATEKNKAKRYELYKVDYMDNANNQEAQALAELLAPYSAVRVDLNSRNTEGKLSSDVLNNNFLTNFINTLQSSLNRKFKDAEGNITYAQDCPLQHFKEFKFRSTQYNLSNILVEKVEGGRIVNRGLFRKEGDQYVPTEYATDLLRISKFNGATSFDNGKNTLYSKMSKADYTTTAFINFFGTEGSINGTPMGNYFMRVPSDSSTQFVVTAPRYVIAQSGNNALRNPDGTINKKHPIFLQLKSAFVQELIDMGDAINTIFVTDDNGVVTRVEKDGKALLQFNPGYSNSPVGRLYKKYHYNGKEVVKNFGSTTVKEELTGNAFKSNRFVIVKEDGTEVNYGQQFIEQFVDFLYGGGLSTNTNESIKFIKEKGRVVGVNFASQSKEFREGIDKMISDFIEDYTREAIKRIKPSKQFIKESMSSLIGEDKDDKEFNRKVSEFILNTHLMYMNFDDLFEGNSKFYGSAQDFLKRAKEVQGSGVPYGIVNYNNSFVIDKKTRKEGALLNDKAIIDKIGDIGQYDSFTAVTIVNSLRTPVGTEYKKADGTGTDGVITKALAANFARQAGRKRPNSRDLERARKMMEGFDESGKGAKVNDAQSYITFEEWVRRIAARGQLMKHLPLIEKIQKGETLTDAEMDAFVQVQKNFYYDQYYDKQTGMIVPRQIKNAEFVLVPQFIKGTQLEQIYNIMKENDIDQLNTEETSKAGKHNVLTLWDNDGNLPEENIADFREKVKGNGVVEYFNYNNLYTQQETPQHVNAENKAGIQIMKKIIDNIPAGHKLYPVKQKFMALYSANVQSAFQDLMQELEVETDENGYPILDDNGQIKGLNYQKLYDLFREEAERLGVDSNLSDYFTLDEEVIKGVATTLMPNFFSNVSNRVESVAQALFNSRITRQKLPGFHGAQVTSIGFKKENIQKSDALRYHTRLNSKGKEVYAPYIEVMLPKSAFGLSAYDNETALKMIQKAGIDELIGYRIPTEGKQSVAIMKVVDFTDDAQGSTIIVPDGWVPQTGSDFDIDSIYGIQFHSYIDDRTGELKVPFLSTSDEDLKKRWHSYIRRNAEVGNAFENIEEDLKEYRETINNKETFTEFADVQRKTTEAFSELPKRFKNLVAQISRDFKEENDKASYRETLENLISKLEKELSNRKYGAGVWMNSEGNTISNKEYDKLSEEEQDDYDWVSDNRNTALEVSDYIQSLKNVVSFLDNQKEVNIAYSKISKITEFLSATQDKMYEDAAKENGLMSLEEFSKLDINLQNSKAARDNEILNCMMTILGDESSMEENLGRSNFDDIIAAINTMINPVVKERRQKRSPYNFFDQADYQDDAMSGAKLKGFSVTRDNLCSVCNTVRPIVSTNAYTMLYDATKYDIKQLKETFGEQNVNLSKDKKYIQVRHKTFGWSRNNRNIAGRILTSYSSQTTAHILDAIKEGAAPNVNDLTFAVYKTFVDIGSDYDTAIGFMAQPAISRIVEAYNKNKSIFTGFNTNPLQQAIRSLAKDIGITTVEKKGKTTKGVPLNKLIDELNSKPELAAAFKQLFGIDLRIGRVRGNEIEFEDFALPTYLLKDRIDETGIFASSPVEETTSVSSYSGMIEADDNAVMVFGSNPLGINGNPTKGTGGAALVALQQGRVTQGEKMDNRLSNNGRAYGLVTVTRPGARQSLSEQQIIENIKQLYKTAKDNPNKTFKIAYQHTNSASLNGYTGKELAEMFKAAGEIPNNIQFSDKWIEAGYFNDLSKVEISSKTLQTAFDLGILLKYSQFANFSQRIGDVARVMNPDKFGAKKNIFETNKIFEDIQELIDRGDMPLQVMVGRNDDGSPNIVSILEAVYPGIGNGTVDTFMRATPDRESMYPPLYSFLKYATAPSIVINKTLFETQTDEFIAAVNSIQDVIGGVSRITEQLYTDFQKYILGEIYSEIPFVKHPVVFNQESNTFDIDINTSKQDEIARIYGFNRSSAFGAPIKRQTAKSVDDIRDIISSKKTLSGKLNELKKLLPKEVLNSVSFDEADYSIEELVSARLAGVKFSQDDVSREVGLNLRKDSALSHSISSTGESIVKVAESIARDINNPFGQLNELNRTDDQEVRDIIINLLSSSQSYDELTHLHERNAVDTLLSNYAAYTQRNSIYTIEEKEFKVKNIYKPTPKELEVWRNLSPAQKVLWIQQNAKNPGVFGLFKVDLRNSNRDFAQTIEFNEDSVNIEDAYSMFMNAFYSENPLIRYAAADLIKYAFVVEGFQMSQHAVNKLIRNTPLMQDIDEGGTGIVSYMRNAVRNIENDINIEQVREDYVKSHDVKGLPKVSINNLNFVNMLDYSKPVTKKELINGKEVETTIGYSSTGVLMVQLNDENISTLIENNLAYYNQEGDLILNPYFKTTGKKSKTYRFKIINGTAYAYPLNKLQRNEHAEWSTKDDNNVVPSPEYFDGLIYGSVDTSRKAEFMAPVTYNENNLGNFNIETLTDNTATKIRNVAHEIAKGNVYYLRSTQLTEYLPKNGDSVTVTIDGIEYDIKHVQQFKTQEKYLGENKDVTIQSKDVAFNDLINNPSYGLRALGFNQPSVDIYSVKLHKRQQVEVTPEEVYSDTTEDLGNLSMEAIFANAEQGDKLAEQARSMLFKTVNSNTKDIPTTADSLFIISNYLTRVVDKINDQLKNFTTEDGRHFNVTDPELINYIRNNPAERRRYLKLLLDARKIKQQFEAFSIFDTTSTDPELKRYLDNIKKKVVELDEALTSNGLELFANDYLAKVSTNPLLKNNNISQTDIITLLDGFYGSGMIEAMINDTQEMPNPLIQIITKEVMADIRAKEMQAEEQVKNFEDTLARIKREAEAAGMSINWDNIVDKSGKLMQPYKDAFIEDYRALKENIERIKNTLGPDGSVDYEALNRAQLALDEWLNDNVELPLKGDEKDEFGINTIKSFYTRKIELEKKMINTAPKLFARYKELQDKRKNVVSRLNSSDSDQRLEQELKDIDIELKSLTSSVKFDATLDKWVDKSKKEIEDAELLRKYKKDIKDLYDEYYDKEENAGFREELDVHLRVIKEAERRDRYGIPQASPEELKHNEKYQASLAWIRKNAIFSPDPETYEKVNEAFKSLRNGKKKSKASEILKVVATSSSAYDSKGRVDGTKLTAEQQRNLTKAQQDDYDSQANVGAVSASLINSAGESDEVYTRDFYKLLSKEGYAKSAEYKAKVKEINDILSKHYGNSKTITWVDMTPDEIQKLANLYRELREIREDIEFSWSNRYAKLHAEDVEYIINQENFDIAKNAAEVAGLDMNLWMAVNTEIVTDDTGAKVRRPNRLIYGRAVPTVDARNKKNARTKKSLYVDEVKTEAFKTVRGYMVSEPNEYYYEEFERRKKQSGNKDAAGNEIPDADGRTFDEWYADNHVYNPYTRTMIPNKAWMSSRLNDNNEGTWEAGFTQSHSVPKEEHKNPNHKDGISLGVNFKNKDGKYRNDVHQNKYEKELQKEISQLLISLAHVESAKRFFESGYMPIMSKETEHNTRFYLKELAKGVGWIEDTSTGKDIDEDINYANDYIPRMPMTDMIKQKSGKKTKLERPVYNPGDDIDEYNKALEEYEKSIFTTRVEEEKYHQEQLNRDWENVIKEFIRKAAHYNAVQDNRLILYYGQEMLKKQLQYDTNIGRRDLKVNNRKSKGAKTVYQTRDSKRQYDQYTNWMRRLMFNQWKYNNPKWTRWANLAQSFTSSNFMMMNIRGGIANVTLGETQIFAEAMAKEYFGTKEYLRGKSIWMANVASYLANMYSDKSSTVADALIKFMNVVDFDQISGVVDANIDAATWLKRARDFMFSPQTMGEHFMQNGAMFSIMVSHRLYENENPELNGRTKYVVKGRAEVIRDAHEKALMKILENDEDLKAQYKTYVGAKLANDNERKELAWFRQDLTTEFVRSLDNDLKKEFIKIKKQYEKEALEEFDKKPDIMSQFTLGDNGKLAFANGSILQELNNSENANSDVNDAYKILGALKGRVISVNKKIHGVYDRMGSAQLEKYWFGALVMQYHKHIYPGIMKRYRRHGYYNEERGTIEKGCYNALIDFLALPIKKYRQDMTDNEVEGMIGIQNLFKNIADFCINMNIHWNLLPEYEKANIRRNLGDICGVLGAVALAIGLRCLGDDDDEDGIIYNLCLYEADRLASESFQFTPFGAISEATKLWSNPVAVQSIINDVLSSVGTMCQILLEGEDYDPYYHSGKYSGQHKLKVYIERRIPVWRGINAIVNIADDNHYYKLGDNMISIIPVKDIANWVKGK